MSGDHAPGVVVPFRPRDQVLRRIRSFRSTPPEFPSLASAPLRIDGEVGLSKLLLGLRTVGLTFKHDQRTGEFVILPDPEAQQ
jgi:hypothetical protein